MSIQFSILASGSTGNAMVVENDEVCLLVDAGFSARKIEALMQSRGRSCQTLDGVLVTHEHSDHIKGLGVLARKYGLNIYANEKTWAAMSKTIGDVPDECKKTFETGGRLDFGRMQVESYQVSHDAADPVGFCFFDGNHKMSLITDTGYISPLVREKVQDSHVIILESNHDVDMLRVGRYPWNVKRRILSDTGHLSNHAAGEALFDLITAETKRVYLAHLSRDHNLMELARMTVAQVAAEMGATLEEQSVQLMDTYYDRPTEWDKLDK